MWLRSRSQISFHRTMKIFHEQNKLQYSSLFYRGAALDDPNWQSGCSIILANYLVI